MKNTTERMNELITRNAELSTVLAELITELEINKSDYLRVVKGLGYEENKRLMGMTINCYNDDDDVVRRVYRQALANRFDVKATLEAAEEDAMEELNELGIDINDHDDILDEVINNTNYIK